MSNLPKWIANGEPCPPPAAFLPKLAYSIPEACAVAGIGRSSLYEEINAGRLVARKRGSSTIILAADLAEYLEALPRVGKETEQ